MPERPYIGTFDVTTISVTNVFSYRYGVSGSGVFNDWTTYTPGAETVYIQNLTTSTVNYDLQRRLQIFQSGLAITEFIDTTVLSIGPTPQFSFSGWDITPSTAQESGMWNWSVDLLPNVSYTGTDTFNITITANFKDNEGNVIDTDSWNWTYYESNPTGSFSLPLFYVASTAYGSFEFTATFSITNDTAIPTPIIDNQTWSDKWLGTIGTPCQLAAELTTSDYYVEFNTDIEHESGYYGTIYGGWVYIEVNGSETVYFESTGSDDDTYIFFWMTECEGTEEYDYIDNYWYGNTAALVNPPAGNYWVFVGYYSIYAGDPIIAYRY